MKRLFNEFYNEEMQEQILDGIFDHQEFEILHQVEMGCLDYEHTARHYFEKEDSIYAYVKKYNNEYILYSDNDVINILIFDNQDEAIEELNKLELTLEEPLYITIENWKKEAKENLDIDIDVEVESSFYASTGKFFVIHNYIGDEHLSEGFSLKDLKEGLEEYQEELNSIGE